jgi:Flp pilus assembly protein TadD
MRRLYYLVGAALVVLGIVLFVPNLQQALRFGARTGGTPPAVQKTSPMTVPPAQTQMAEPGRQDKMAEMTKQDAFFGHTGPSKQASEGRRLPEISWSPGAQVPAPGRQGPLSTGIIKASEPKTTPSPFDTEQSIVVRRTNVKDSAAELYNNALRQMELGRTEDARGSYLAVLADKPNDAETLNNLGVLVMNGGNTRDAFSYFKMALNARADYAKAHNNLGILYMKEGQDRPAEEHLRQALKLEPDSVEPHLNLSALLRSKGRFQEASQLLAGLLKKGCKQPIVHLSYAIINDEMGKYPEAATYYREYLSEAAQGAERNTVAERLKVLEGHRLSGNR